MKLMIVPVRPAFWFRCTKCGKVYHSTCDQHLFKTIYADIDGVPFQDYYCEPCRNVLRNPEADHVIKEVNIDEKN